MKIIKLLLKGLGLIVLIAVSAFSFFVYQVSQDRLSESIPEIDTQREARLLTAFFGRDSDLPLSALILYRKALNKDGMPLVFSQEVDPSTLEVTDFEVTTRWYNIDAPSAVTFTEQIEAGGMVLGASLVTYALEPDETGTRAAITVAVVSFVGPEMMEEFKAGWAGGLTKLNALAAKEAA